MPILYAYKKSIDSVTTHYIKLPEIDGAGPTGEEIATLPDGSTVVVLYDGFTLPENQPVEIADSIELLPNPLPTDLREEIKAASQHVALINSCVQAAIAEQYCLADEIKLLRTAPSEEMSVYNAYVEDCRAWGRAEKSKLGL